MAGFTPFTNNYSDLSDENGYQFEFRCDICGSGYRSEFVRSNLGTAGKLSAAQEQAFLAKFTARLDELVNQTPPPRTK